MSWDCTKLSIVKIVVCDLRRCYLRAKATFLHNDNGEGTSLCGRVRVSCQRRWGNFGHSSANGIIACPGSA